MKSMCDLNDHLIVTAQSTTTVDEIGFVPLNLCRNLNPRVMCYQEHGAVSMVFKCGVFKKWLQ